MGFLIIFLLSILIALIAGYKYIQTREVIQENQLMEAYMDSMHEFYLAVQDRIEATRRYRHDLARHIQTLQSLLEQRENDTDTRDYMNNLVEQYSSLKKEEYCTSEIINSILSIKMQQCTRRQISLTIHTEDRNYHTISDFDMVSLLHNLLDNAIEAVDRIPSDLPKEITFSMGKDGQTIWIDLINSVTPGEEITFQTQKANKAEHGIGTKIIDSVIEKYNGHKELSLDKEQGIFHEKLFLSEA